MVGPLRMRIAKEVLEVACFFKILIEPIYPVPASPPRPPLPPLFLPSSTFLFSMPVSLCLSLHLLLLPPYFLLSPSPLSASSSFCLPFSFFFPSFPFLFSVSPCVFLLQLMWIFSGLLQLVKNNAPNCKPRASLPILASSSSVALRDPDQHLDSHLSLLLSSTDLILLQFPNPQYSVGNPL